MKDTPIISIEEISEVGPDVPEIPMSDEGQSALDMIGLGKPVNEKDYQIKHPYMEQLKEQQTLKVLPKQGDTPPKPVGSSRVFQTTPHYDAAKAAQLAQAELAKRPYLPHMHTALPEASPEAAAGGSGGAIPPIPPTMPDFQMPSSGGNFSGQGFTGTPNFDDLPQFDFGENFSAPQNTSDKINGTGSVSLAHFITKLLLEDGYPAAMEFVSKCDLQPYKNRNLPLEARKSLQKTVDDFNRRIKANSRLDAELVKEFRDALALCLAKWGIHTEVSPEGRLLYATIKIISEGVKTGTRNIREMGMLKEDLLDQMVKTEKTYAEYLRVLNESQNAA